MGNYISVEATSYVDEGFSDHVYAFDEYSRNWSMVHDQNYIYLKRMEQLCNILLQTRGHLYLIEVLDILGIDYRDEATSYGWINGLEGHVDHISFGIFDPARDSQRVKDYIDYDCGYFIINFNCYDIRPYVTMPPTVTVKSLRNPIYNVPSDTDASFALEEIAKAWYSIGRNKVIFADRVTDILYDYGLLTDKGGNT